MEPTPIARTFIRQLTEMRAGEHVDVPGYTGVRCRMNADGRIFLLEPSSGGTKETFLFHKSNGTIYLGTDYVVSNGLLQ